MNLWFATHTLNIESRMAFPTLSAEWTWYMIYLQQVQLYQRLYFVCISFHSGSETVFVDLETVFATHVISCITLNTSPNYVADNNQTRLVDSSKLQPCVSPPTDLMLPMRTCSMYKSLKILATQDKQTSSEFPKYIVSCRRTFPPGTVQMISHG